MKAAYVTLLTKNTYLPGVLVLHQSLLDVSTRYPLVVMITESLPEDGKEVLRKRGIEIAHVDRLSPEEGKHTLSSVDSRFADTWTKLRSVISSNHTFTLLFMNLLLII